MTEEGPQSLDRQNRTDSPGSGATIGEFVANSDRSFATADGSQPARRKGVASARAAFFMLSASTAIAIPR